MFADLFLGAHDADLRGEPVPRPWRLAFGADPAMHPLGHLLLGLNAHIDDDLRSRSSRSSVRMTSPTPPSWPRATATTRASTRCSSPACAPRAPTSGGGSGAWTGPSRRRTAGPCGASCASRGRR
ncbi:DUF5995 family protein, partial [Bradyrhizobium sp. NBAIM08]|uniref:DUF5995 family protein n=1 Tax=Bradyrhizobium sp. NBAIM08 TaxID=2793815 RepID=UPI001CD1B776